jgi:hypothetical protein
LPEKSLAIRAEMVLVLAAGEGDEELVRPTDV